MPTDDLGQRLDTQLLRSLSRHKDQSRGTIVQVRRVGSSNATALFETWRQGRDLLEDDPLVLFVLLHDCVTLPALDGHRSDLGIESARLPSTVRSLVRLDRVGILSLTTDAVFRRGSLATVPHGEVVVNIPKTIVLKSVLGLELAKSGVLAGNQKAGKR